MALDSYDGLKQEIADHLDRDDLASSIDGFIDLAEARHKREIRIREMSARSQATATERFLSLPPGFLQAQTLRILTSPVTALTELSLHEMNRVRRETTGKPAYFTIHGGEIEFDVTPDESLTVETVFYAALTPLSAAAPSNALLVRAPDLYLYAALAASAPFLMNDERLELWAALYSTGRDFLNMEDRMSRRIGPLVSRVSGATP